MIPININRLGSSAIWQDAIKEDSFQHISQDEAIQDFLNIPSDMESFLELGNIKEVTEREVDSTILPNLLHEFDIGQEIDDSDMDCSFETNQTLIDEVENYLKSVSGESSMVEESMNTELEESWDMEKICESETSQKADTADKIFQALTTGNVMQDAGISLTENDLKCALTTSMVGSDGENVVIIIAPQTTPSDVSGLSPSRSTISPDPLAMSPGSVTSQRYTMSPSNIGSPGSCSSDYDWTPSPATTSSVPAKPRKKYQRKVQPRPPSGPYPKEKFERKKAQNRTAAFKYREKKKAEQEAVDDELVRLTDRNVALKKRLADVDIEVKCLKKLIAEVGLVF